MLTLNISLVHSEILNIAASAVLHHGAIVFENPFHQAKVVHMNNFDEGNIDKAIEYAQTNCARPHITYTELFMAADMQTPQWYHENGGQRVIGDFMEAFHDTCRKRGLPPFDAFVVNESGERAHFPGVGYFTVNGLKDPLSEKTTKSDAEFSLGFQRDEREAIREWCRHQ